jgi:hypothetical protein
MRRYRPIACLFFLAVFSGSRCLGAVHHVPDPFPTIQAAVEASASGDTVEVAAGDYDEDVSIVGKAIHLHGAGLETTSMRSCEIESADATEGLRGSIVGFSIEGSLDVMASFYEHHLRDCALLGAVTVVQPEVHSIHFLSISSCEFHGPCTVVNRSVPGGELTVTECRFYDVDLEIAGESRAVIVASTFYGCGMNIEAEEGAEIRGNTVAGALGIRARSAQASTIEGNSVTGASVGIDLPLQNGFIDIISNEIDGCEVGIFVAGGGLLASVSGNRVRNCETAIHMAENDGVLRNNVVYSCVSGIVAGDDVSTIERNTVYDCEAIGIDVEPSFAEIRGNIVASCEIGIQAPGELERTIECNDVWNNRTLNWSGVPDPQGVDGNISVDPIFCSPVFGEFTLAEDSPCLPGNHPNGADCGIIGALGQGCGASADVEEGEWAGSLAPRIEIHPNPARSVVRCRLEVEAAEALRVSLVDASGRNVATLHDGLLASGVHEIEWRRQDASAPLAAGVYCLRVTGRAGGSAARIVLLND